MDKFSLPGQRRDKLVPAGMQGFSSSKQQNLLEWIQPSEGKTKFAEAEKDAWVPFKQQFPNADKSQFVAQAMTESKDNVSAEIFFKKGPGSLQSVFASDKNYWSQRMKTALGLEQVAGFLYQLSPIKNKSTLPIPAVDLTKKAPSLKKNLQQTHKHLRHA